MPKNVERVENDYRHHIAGHDEIMGKNTGNILNPVGNATRAEAVTMLYRVVDIFEIPAP